MGKKDSLEQLIEGYKNFRQEYVADNYAAYRTWACQTQIPKVMMISCSDSRVNPAIVTHSGLGEVFMVNNVANLVPPYRGGKNTHHSTSAALEYAISHIKVEHIIIMGHSGCGGIKALMDGVGERDDGAYSFIEPWMEIAQSAKQKILEEHGDCNHDEQLHLCEREALLVSLKNLETFPWVREAMANQGLKLHAWHFDIETGSIWRYSDHQNKFVTL